MTIEINEGSYFSSRTYKKPIFLL